MAMLYRTMHGGYWSFREARIMKNQAIVAVWWCTGRSLLYDKPRRIILIPSWVRILNAHPLNASGHLTHLRSAKLCFASILKTVINVLQFGMRRVAHNWSSLSMHSELRLRTLWWQSHEEITRLSWLWLCMLWGPAVILSELSSKPDSNEMKRNPPATLFLHFAIKFNTTVSHWAEVHRFFYHAPSSGHLRCRIRIICICRHAERYW